MSDDTPTVHDGHMILVCLECERVMQQCRCATPGKPRVKSAAPCAECACKETMPDDTPTKEQARVAVKACRPDVGWAADVLEARLAHLEAENDRLERKSEDLTRGFRCFLDALLCEEHTGRVRMQSSGEFLAEHHGKCVLCMERERDEARTRCEGLRKMISCEEYPDIDCTKPHPSGGQSHRCLTCQIRDAKAERDKVWAELKRLAQWVLEQRYGATLPWNTVDAAILIGRERGRQVESRNAELKRLREDQRDWRKGVALIASALGENSPPDLFCGRIADRALELRAELERLRASLQSIAAFQGQCLLGPDHGKEATRSYSAGANAAFEQCAGIANAALRAQRDEENADG